MKKLLHYLGYLFLWITEQILGSQKLNWTKYRERFYKNQIKKNHSKPNVWRAIETVRMSFLDINFFKNLPNDRPLLIKGAFANSSCSDKWTWEYMKTALHGYDQAFTDTTKHNFNTGIKSSTELIDNILSDIPRYSILFGDILYKKPELLSDLETPKWIDLTALKYKMNLTWQFFAAGKGRKTNLHSELGSSLSLQIRGEKKWTIFSPKYSVNVYPRVSWRMYLESNYHSDFSQVMNSELGIQGYQVTLEPGDILWCPSFFWHFVENKTASLSVSCKWTSTQSFLRHPFLSTIILSSRHPSALMRLPIIRLFARLHPPVG